MLTAVQSAPSNDDALVPRAAGYVPGAVSRLVPIRLQLLALLRRHDEALRYVVDELDAPELAFEYCTEHATTRHTDYTPSSNPAATVPEAVNHSSSSTLFLGLLTRYTTKPDLEAANALLRRLPPSVPVLEALRCLPPTLPVGALSEGLCALLARANERMREAQMRSSLFRAVSVQTRAELLEKRGQRLIVREETQCSVCARRIGTSAFAALPDGAFAHISCAHGLNLT